MKKVTPNKPLFDQDKQKKPMDGEVSLKDARTKAALFAAREKSHFKQR